MNKAKKIIFAVTFLLSLSACGASKNISMHTVSFNSNGGSSVEPQMVVHGGKIEKPDDPTRYGYNFKNWNYEDKEWSFKNDIVVEDMVLDAAWDAVKYNIFYFLDGGTQNPTNPKQYTIEDSFTFNDPTKTGYTFVGWFNGNTKVSGISTGTSGDITLTAHWYIKSYNVTVVSSDSSKGSVSGIGSYEYSSTVTVKATPEQDCVFKGWYSDSGLRKKVSNDSTYIFSMPQNNVTLYAKFLTEIEEQEWNVAHGVIPTVLDGGKYITYGMYPQSNIDDPSLISALNLLDDPVEYGYYYYNNEYYYKYLATPYENGYLFDNGISIIKNTAYWFNVEPIKWKVLENDNGTYFLTSHSLLINNEYCERFFQAEPRTDYQGNTGTAYSNNYKYSDIRNWLNTDFYNQAFFLDDDNIKISVIDNSVSSTLYDPNKYACEDTNDKLFIMSAKELTTPKYGFEDDISTLDPARQIISTDFAKAHGIYMDNDPSSSSYKHSGYFTRSPKNDSLDLIRSVHCDGHFDKWFFVDDGVYGVNISLKLSL